VVDADWRSASEVACVLFVQIELKTALAKVFDELISAYGESFHVPIMCHVGNCSAWEAIAMTPGNALIPMCFMA
jgi:hypothetical protein